MRLTVRQPRQTRIYVNPMSSCITVTTMHVHRQHDHLQRWETWPICVSLSVLPWVQKVVSPSSAPWNAPCPFVSTCTRENPPCFLGGRPPPYVGRASIGAALGLIQRVQSDVFYSRLQTVHLGCARGRENIRVVTLSRSYMNP